ncbi:unnamed protein product [Meloidogyne enterolobii]|uniref:Uncharacterized protein n=1 Tax=Meloidogyne enterolobii TaxID=390850 RepID=A0ACB0YMJ5_MELEN
MRRMTGHSLGGAFASFASARTVKSEIKRSGQVQLYTVQPRLGNADFAFAHDKLVPMSFRVVHRMDIVPHMPACDKTDNWPGVRPNNNSKPAIVMEKEKLTIMKLRFGILTLSLLSFLFVLGCSNLLGKLQSLGIFIKNFDFFIFFK